MNADKATVLRTYASEALASIAVSRLRSEGIEANIQKDDCGGAYPSLQIVRGVRLLIRPEDLEDAEKILNELEEEESGKMEPEEDQEERLRTTSCEKSFEISIMKERPTQQLEELRTIIYMYVVFAPLLSALFADKIDNIFIVCLLFVGLVGVSLVSFKNRMERLDELLKEQERRLEELEAPIARKLE